MGLFGGGNSRTETRNTTNQTTESRNVALQDFEGVGVAGNEGPVNITMTADGAFEVVERTADRAISAGERTAELAESLGLGAYDFAADIVDGSHTFARDNARDAFDFGRSSLDAITGLVDKVTEASSDTLAGTVNALQGIAREQNTSLEARNQKLVTWVVVAVVALAAIQQFASRRKKG